MAQKDPQNKNDIPEAEKPWMMTTFNPKKHLLEKMTIFQKKTIITQ